MIKEQSTRLICSLRETKWQCTFNKRTMYGAIGANTNSPYDKMYRGTAKTVQTFEQSDGTTNAQVSFV